MRSRRFPVPFDSVSSSLAGHHVPFAAASAGAQVIPFIGPEPTTRTTFMSAAPDATLVIDFEEHHLTATNETTGFLPDFTELGFVTFHTNSNYGQEIIYGG